MGISHLEEEEEETKQVIGFVVNFVKEQKSTRLKRRGRGFTKIKVGEVWESIGF